MNTKAVCFLLKLLLTVFMLTGCGFSPHEPAPEPTSTPTPIPTATFTPAPPTNTPLPPTVTDTPASPTNTPVATNTLAASPFTQPTTVAQVPVQPASQSTPITQNTPVAQPTEAATTSAQSENDAECNVDFSDYVGKPYEAIAKLDAQTGKNPQPKKSYVIDASQGCILYWTGAYNNGAFPTGLVPLLIDGKTGIFLIQKGARVRINSVGAWIWAKDFNWDAQVKVSDGKPTGCMPAKVAIDILNTYGKTDSEGVYRELDIATNVEGAPYLSARMRPTPDGPASYTVDTLKAIWWTKTGAIQGDVLELHRGVGESLYLAQSAGEYKLTGEGHAGAVLCDPLNPADRYVNSNQVIKAACVSDSECFGPDGVWTGNLDGMTDIQSPGAPAGGYAELTPNVPGHFIICEGKVLIDGVGVFQVMPNFCTVFETDTKAGQRIRIWQSPTQKAGFRWSPKKGCGWRKQEAQSC